MATKATIIPIRVTREDRARLRKAAGEEPVSSWLRRLGLAEAQRREAAAAVRKSLDALAAAGLDMTEEAAARLAAEAKREARARRR